MRTLRRRVVVPAAVGIVLVVIVAGTAWYFLSGERRLGPVVGWALRHRTGLSIAVGRASWDGRRLRLRDVHLPPSADLPLDVRVPELTLDARLVMLVRPAARVLDLTVPAASAALDPSVTRDGSVVEPLRGGLLALLAWPAVLRGRVSRLELRTAARVVTLSLTAEKQGPGITLTLGPPGGIATGAADDGAGPRVGVRGFAALGQALDVVVDVAASPRGPAVVWTDTTLAASPVGGRVQLQVLAGGVVSAFGRLSFGTDASALTTLDVTARYDSVAGELGVSRCLLARGERLRLSGTGRMAREASGPWLVLNGAGVAGASRARARARYELVSGAFEADVRLDGVDAGETARRLGVTTVAAAARGADVRLSGRLEMRILEVSSR